MKIVYVFPRLVDVTFQNTTENELARAVSQLGHTMETVQGYRHKKEILDGFTHVEYVHLPSGSLVSKLRLHMRTLRYAWNSDADVILFAYSAAHLIPLLALRKRLGRSAKLVLDIRSVPVDVPVGLRGRIWLARYNIALRLADRFCDGLTAITPMLRDTLLPHLRRLQDNVGIWSSGVNVSFFRKPTTNLRTELGLLGRKVLLYHGVLSPNRGISNLVEAVALLKDEFANLALLIVGDGPGRGEIEGSVRRLGVEDRVIMTGRVPYTDIPKYLRSADAGVLPFPNIEWWAVSSPIKLMEYLALGLPVIATEIAAIRHVSDVTGGVLHAKSEQPSQLADAIRTYLLRGCPSALPQAVETTITWESQAQSLLRYLNALPNRPNT